MTAGEVIDALNLAGVRIEFDSDGPHLRGLATPGHLAGEVKEQRAAIIEEAQRRATLDRDRYGVAPPDNCGLRETASHVREDVRLRLLDYVWNQGPVVREWFERRTLAYFERRAPGRHELANGNRYWHELETTVALELLCWQRHCDSVSAIEFVDGIGEVASQVRKAAT